MEEIDKVKEKIRKLLARASDDASSETEVNKAIRTINKLKTEYEIENIDKLSGEIKKGNFFINIERNESKHFCVSLATAIGEANDVYVYWQKVYDDSYYSNLGFKIKMIGSDDDIEQAQNQTLVLRDKFLKLSRIRYREYCVAHKAGRKSSEGYVPRKTDRRVWHRSYQSGCVKGIREALKAQSVENMSDEEKGKKYELIKIKKSELIERFKIENNIFVKSVRTDKGSLSQSAFSEGVKDARASGGRLQIRA